MKKLCVLLALMISIVTLSRGQKQAYSELEDALLWRVSGNGLETNSYLFGTIHVSDYRVFQYGDALPIALNEVESVYGEIDLTDIAAQFAVMKRLMMEENLSELISEEEHELVKKRAGNGSALLMMNKMKPFFTMAELMRTMVKADSSMVLDMHLLELGKQLGKKIGGVETLEEQIDAIDKISIEDQVSMLLELCENMEEQQEMMENLLVAYLKEDLNKMLELSEAEMEKGEYKDLEATLLKNRNIVMVERLKTMMKESSLLFGVGALHLPSEDGLIHRLRLEGYTVEAIKSNRPQLPKRVPFAPSK